MIETGKAKVVLFPRIARQTLLDVISTSGSGESVMDTIYRAQPELVDLLTEFGEKGGKPPHEVSATISGAALVYLGLKKQMEKGE